MKPFPWRRRLLRGLVLYIFTPYLAVAAILVLFQRKLLFQPTKTERLLASQQPGAGVKFDDVELKSTTGPALYGWRFHAQPARNAERFLVLYFPGNGGCRAHRVPDCSELARLGCETVIFDYAGYGDNDGSPSETRIVADAHRIWKFATDELGFAPNRILFFGESLGGAVSMRLASELCAAGTPPAAVILNSTFDTLANVIAGHYPMFPFRFLLWDRFDSAGCAGKIACPILQFHGTADDIVPFDRGRALHDRLNSDVYPHVFITIEGAGHNFITVGMMQEEISDLLRRLP
jgi:pimeloyl-ACP methyl ester carboxylesterase